MHQALDESLPLRNFSGQSDGAGRTGFLRSVNTLPVIDKHRRLIETLIRPVITVLSSCGNMMTILCSAPLDSLDYQQILK